MSLDTFSPQPHPTPGRSDVTALVMADLAVRAEAGAKKYGQPLMTHNGRNSLVDAYQESLDQTSYLRQAIEEMEAYRQFIRDTLKDGFFACVCIQPKWECWHHRALALLGEDNPV